MNKLILMALIGIMLLSGCTEKTDDIVCIVISNTTGEELFYGKNIQECIDFFPETTTTTTLPLNFTWSLPKCCRDVPYHWEYKHCRIIEDTILGFNMKCKSQRIVYDEECYNGWQCYVTVVNDTPSGGYDYYD